MSLSYLNKKIGKIGVTSATERDPITSDKFNFWMASNRTVAINISDIVAIPEDDNSTTFGQVIGIERYTDSVSHISNFISSDFGKPDNVPPTQRIKMVLVRCGVIINTRNKKSPIETGLPVYYASPEGIEKAFGFKDYESPIPAGIFTNGDGEKTIVKLDSKFVLGKEGAHLTVSGISGLATKTSYVMFLLQSIIQKTQRIAAVIFNVKSDDLLYIDRENPSNKFNDHEKLKYQQLGINPIPFLKENVKYFLPRNRLGGYNSSRMPEDEDNIYKYAYDLEDSRGRIIYLFEREDINEPLEALISTIEEKLIEWRESGKVRTFNGLLSAIRVEPQSRGGFTSWEGHHGSTVIKFKSRIRHFVQRGTTGVFVAGEKEEDEKCLRYELRKLKKGNIYVIDIERLNPREQSFVFGDVITTLSELLSGGYEEENEGNGKLDVEKVIVYVDELNKFAPSGTAKSPLKRHLIDIAARGRSIGFCLFGAEQFASGVDYEIIGNCSTSVLGRTNAVELSNRAYRFLSPEFQSVVLKLEQGKLLLNHAKYFRPIIISFPFPSYQQGKSKKQN